jgi:hypothetical protein
MKTIHRTEFHALIHNRASMFSIKTKRTFTVIQKSEDIYIKTTRYSKCEQLPAVQHSSSARIRIYE